MATVDLEALATDLYENGFGGSDFLQSGQVRYLYTHTAPQIEVSSTGSVYIEEHLLPSDNGWEALDIIKKHLAAGDAARTEEGEHVTHPEGATA